MFSYSQFATLRSKLVYRVRLYRISEKKTNNIGAVVSEKHFNNNIYAQPLLIFIKQLVFSVFMESTKRTRELQNSEIKHLEAIFIKHEDLKKVQSSKTQI